MIFYQFNSKLLDNIELLINYHLSEIEISIRWSSNSNLSKRTVSYLDDECTLPSTSPLFYLCSSSSKGHSLNPTFYSYWFQLDSSFYRRLFGHVTADEDHFVLLLSLPDGRILALPESSSSTDVQPILWYTSSHPGPVTLLGLYYDLNTNLLDAVLSSSANSKFPKLIVNHLILCEPIGCLVVISASTLRRILIDNTIQSACVYASHFLYITTNEIRSISITNLLKPVNEEIISQTKSLRFGHYDKLVVDGQEIILYYQNGTFERLNNLLPRSSATSRGHSLAHQTKKLACLTTTITNLQTNASVLQRLLHKVELFYQLNLAHCLKLLHHQWKLVLTEPQLRVFQPQDFVLILLCQVSSTKTRIYQLNPTNNWTFKSHEPIPTTSLCQPILILRSTQSLYCRLACRRIVLPLEEHIREDEPCLENYFPSKFRPSKKNSAVMQQYYLAMTLRNDAALHFKKLNLNLARRLLMGQTDVVHIEVKQQDIKVDTDAGLVDSLTIQVILSSACLRRLIITFSTLTEIFYGHRTNEEKNFIKQTDITKLIDLIQDTQTKLTARSNSLADDLLLNLLQIRIFLAMFRLGSNYTVQVY